MCSSVAQGVRWPRPICNRPTVHTAFEAALLAGLHPGDTIRTIDGRDFEDFFRSGRKYIAVSSVREARFALVCCPYLFPTSFTLALSTGRTVHVTRAGAPLERKPELKVDASDRRALCKGGEWRADLDRQRVDMRNPRLNSAQRIL